MKIFALYLPQFHQIPENDKWWGEGFTEWNNVKSAKKYADNQIQPRVPKDGYYDLSDINCIRHQIDLANQYLLDGFCFYHYYSVGKKLLSKPAELLLENKDINTTFFFSWANHDWRRTWAGYNTEVLLKQEYGKQEDIVRHYEYLRDFFKDERYLKIDNRPVFMIYQNFQKEDFELYKSIFERMAMEDGFSGIYWIGTLKSSKDHFNVQMDDYYKCEADFTRNSPGIANFIFRIKNKKISLFKRKANKPFSMSYDLITKKIDAFSKHEPHYIQGVCAGWDNTPRHKERGYYYRNFTPEIFKRHFANQLIISKKYDKPFMIINAWNEWGEGAYLEPDEWNGNSLLACIQDVRLKNNI